MSKPLVRALSWIGVTAAVCAGAVIAYYQRSSDDADGRDRFDVPPASPPATLVQPPHRAPPADGTPSRSEPEPADGVPESGGTGDTESGEGAAPGADQGTESSPEPGPAQRPGANAARLPEFFARSLNTDAPPQSLEEGTPQALQARLESEPRDEAWAARVEWQLENYLALQPHDESFGSPRVTCRSTVCRVITTTSKRAMARNPDADWHEMMAALQYETVSNEFARSAETIVFNHSEPDRVGYVTYFERKTSRAP